MDFVEELRWRGLLHDIMPGTEEMLNEGQVTGYAGFDPTADSLHIGNLVPVMLLVHFQRSGHKPIALVGGATGMIGDPSGKSEERQFLSEEVLEHNLECQKKQLSKFLDFNSGDNAAELVNNYDWYKGMNFLTFMREVGKHITVNYMVAKDSVKKRLETGISFTEFSYQLVQGYDFYWLNRHKQCRLQMGGSDQWGNMVTGTELIRRKGEGETEAFALTAPLITKADGSKFGKSESGNVWLDPERTSPYIFYQYWMKVSDEDARRFIKIFTLMGRQEIDDLIARHDENPGARELQKVLAREITTLVHSKEDYEVALAATDILFGKGTKEQLVRLPEPHLLSVFKDVPTSEVGRNIFGDQLPVTDFLVEHTGIFASKGEARRMLKGNGVSLNKEKIGEDRTLTEADLLGGKYLLVQKGKKNYFFVKVK